MKWTRIEAGVWKCAIGDPDPVTPLSVVGARPQGQRLQEMGEPELPAVAGVIEIGGAGDRIVLTVPMEDSEQIFGLGLQFMKVDQRGRTRYLRVNSDPVQDTGESHAPVPFYVSSRGYGFLVNTARIVTLCCGSTVRRESQDRAAIRDRNQDPTWTATPPGPAIEIVVPTPGAECILFSGQTMLEVVQRYNLFCGGGCLPPRWGLGFWHRVPTQYTDEQVLAELDEFRSRGFPCDVIGLEPGWHTRSYPCTFEWNPDRFRDPAGFVKAAAERGARINLWEHAYISPDAATYPPLAPLSGSHTVWGGLVPDWTLPKARQILKDQHLSAHISLGVSGYKLDECDGSELTGSSWMFPGHATFPSGLDGEQMRQIYGLLLQKIMLEMFEQQDRRTYGLVRASGAGASGLPFVLYSDLYDHKQFIRALCNSGFSGLLWTPEIRSASSAEDWVRRMQTVCFSPLAMLNAWSDGTRPWSFPEVEQIIRETLELRMRLLPYFYSAFARYHFDGTPPFRGMALELPASIGESPEGRAASASEDQYMAGDSILVAPLVAGQRWRNVYLPAGDWYDFENGGRFRGGQSIKVFPGLRKLPLFVRDGAIIPLGPSLAHAPGPGEPIPLEARCYGSGPAAFRLYDDDGETFAYERGDFQWRELRADRLQDGQIQASIEPSAAGRRSWVGEVTWNWIGRNNIA